ncbi:MAG: response regulator, partial [Qipengyuania vulgaris]
QILLNLLSNAFKFTSEGKVSLNVRMATSGWNREHPQLSGVNRALAISVTDTGIGIPEDKQKLIFEAFQQADGTTSRKYGGTGLGLSISREIAGLLGGELQVSSTFGEGSTFTLYLPLDPPKIDKSSDDTATREQHAQRIEHIDGELDPMPSSAEPFVLVVTGDTDLADRVADEAQAHGLATNVASSGAAAISTSRRTPPAAVVIDTSLHDMDGTVLADMLAHQQDFATRPIWIVGEPSTGDGHVASVRSRSNVFESPRDTAAEMLGKLKEAIGGGGNETNVDASGEWTLDGRHILIVDDDIRNIFSLASVLEARGASVVYAERGADGIEMLRAKSSIDAALIDIMMPEMDGYETMQRIRQDDALSGIPLIAVTAKAMRGDRLKCLEAGADDYISKPVDIELLMAVLRVAFDRAPRLTGEASVVEAAK